MRSPSMACAAVLCALCASQAAAKLVENGDPEHGLRALHTPLILVDKKIMAFASGAVSTEAGKQTVYPTITLTVGNRRSHPAWRGIKGYATVYTPLRQFRVPIASARNKPIKPTVEMTFPIKDFLHMARGQKARVVYGQISFTLLRKHLVQMQELSDTLQSVTTKE